MIDFHIEKKRGVLSLLIITGHKEIARVPSQGVAKVGTDKLLGWLRLLCQSQVIQTLLWLLFSPFRFLEIQKSCAGFINKCNLSCEAGDYRLSVFSR